MPLVEWTGEQTNLAALNVAKVGQHALHRYSPTAHVYFLLLNGKVVYIGLTWNLPARIALHRKEQLKRFNDVLYLTVGDDDARDTEAAFIEQFRPRYNAQFNPSFSPTPSGASQ